MSFCDSRCATPVGLQVAKVGATKPGVSRRCFNSDTVGGRLLFGLITLYVTRLMTPTCKEHRVLRVLPVCATTLHLLLGRSRRVSYCSGFHPSDERSRRRRTKERTTQPNKASRFEMKASDDTTSIGIEGCHRSARCEYVTCRSSRPTPRQVRRGDKKTTHTDYTTTSITTFIA